MSEKKCSVHHWKPHPPAAQQTAPKQSNGSESADPALSIILKAGRMCGSQIQSGSWFNGRG